MIVHIVFIFFLYLQMENLIKKEICYNMKIYTLYAAEKHVWNEYPQE